MSYLAPLCKFTVGIPEYRVSDGDFYWRNTILAYLMLNGAKQGLAVSLHSLQPVNVAVHPPNAFYPAKKHLKMSKKLIYPQLLPFSL